GPPVPFRLRTWCRSAWTATAKKPAGSRFRRFACSGQPGATPIGVWVYGLEEACIIDACHLTRTGVRVEAEIDLPRLYVRAMDALIAAGDRERARGLAE